MQSTARCSSLSDLWSVVTSVSEAPEGSAKARLPSRTPPVAARPCTMKWRREEESRREGVLMVVGGAVGLNYPAMLHDTGGRGQDCSCYGRTQCRIQDLPDIPDSLSMHGCCRVPGT